MDYIEEKIQKALEAISARAKADNWKGEKPWTKAVKKAIVDVAKGEKWGTAANQCEEADENREFLYDIFCYRRGKESMSEVQLVAESEWYSEGHIIEDFDKLLVARSTYRVMVFQADSKKSVDDLVEKMRKRIENFRVTPGDRYLFAGWVGEPEGQFFFNSHVVGQQ